MTDKAGGIEFYIDADASSIDAARNSVKESALQMEMDFKRVDDAVNKTGTTQEGLSRKVSTTSGKNVASTNKVVESQRQLQATLVKTSKQYSKSTKATQGMGRSTGQAAIQVQQLVGQVSGGVNPLIAFSQQAADIGIVMGAPMLGSIIGVGAALGTFLLPNVFKAKSALEQLEEISETINKTMETSADGTLAFSDSLLSLSRRSKVLAQVQIAKTIGDVATQTKSATTIISDSIDKVANRDFKALSDALIETGLTVDEFMAKFESGFSNVYAPGAKTQFESLRSDISSLSKEFKITESQAGQLAEAMGFFAENKNALGIGALRSTLEDLSKETGNSSKKLVDFTSKLIPLFEKVSAGVDITNELRTALSGVDGELKGQASTEISKINVIAKELADSLLVAQTELTQGEAAASRLAIALAHGFESANELPEDIKNSLDGLDEVARKRAKIAKEQSDYAKFQAELDKQIRKESLEAEREKASLIAEFNGIAQGTSSPLEKIQEKLAAEREVILAHQAALLEDETLSSQQRAQIREQHQNDILSIEQKAANARAEIEEREKQSKLAAVSGMFSNLSNLMNTGSKKLFAIGKASAIAGAIVDGYAAVSKTMASTPYPFNIPLAAAQAAASAVQVQNIAKQKIGGASSISSAGTFSGGQPAVRTTEGQSFDRNITIAGIDRNSLISGGQLVDTLNQALGDGYSINFAGG